MVTESRNASSPIEIDSRLGRSIPESIIKENTLQNEGTISKIT